MRMRVPGGAVRHGCVQHAQQCGGCGGSSEAGGPCGCPRGGRTLPLHRQVSKQTSKHVVILVCQVERGRMVLPQA